MKLSQSWARLAVALLLLVMAAVVVYDTLQVQSYSQSGGISVMSTNQKITTDRNGQTLNVLGGGKLSAAAGSTAVFSGDLQATVVRVNSTPVFWVTAIPTPTSVISNSLYTVCGSDTITGTKAIAHGLATPSYVIADLGEDATGDHSNVSVTNASATVTIKVWNSALTPAASQAGAVVKWCAFGTK